MNERINCVYLRGAHKDKTFFLGSGINNLCSRKNGRRRGGSSGSGRGGGGGGAKAAKASQHS